MILKCILPKYVHFNGLKFSGALEHFVFYLTVFGYKKAKNNVLKKIKVFGAFWCIESKCRWLQTG